MSTPGSADAGNAGDGGGTNVLMKHVAPALGVIVATMLFASPVTVVRAVRQQRQLGSLNPLPYCAMLANTVAWLVYAFLTADPYVLASNVPGVLLSTWLTFSCYGFADDRLRAHMLTGVLAFIGLLVAAGIFISFFHLDHAAMVSVWGSVTVGILIVFYSAPLTALAEVFRTRSSATLYLPFAAMNLANGLLWTGYGAAIPDAFIWGPNLVGAVFGALQTVLCLVYPSIPTGERDKAATPPSLHSHEDSEAGSMLYDASVRGS